jgi:hypothetical protein
MALGASVLCWWTPTPARAWGNEGHEVVALIAQAALQPATRAAVQELLALEPGATLQSIATWADEHRSPATAPWHYVNFPRDSCSYEAARDCPDGHCVVAALHKQTEILARSSDPEKRLKALKYVVHFMGDVHQPLHAGFADDRGANEFPLKRFMQQVHLHGVWDSGLIRYTRESAEALAARLSRQPAGAASADTDPVRIAQESCTLVQAPGFYPGTGRIDGTYLQHYLPVMEQRLVLAGLRLASLLNTTLGSPAPQAAAQSALGRMLGRLRDWLH